MADAANFTGWHRSPGGIWQEVCHGATEREVWDRLLNVPEAGDKTVTRAGRHPDDRRRQPGLFA
jgi:hypothetical protein